MDIIQFNVCVLTCPYPHSKQSPIFYVCSLSLELSVLWFFLHMVFVTLRGITSFSCIQACQTNLITPNIFLPLFCLQIIEARLKVTLPEDLPSALMDGVVLCHLVNNVRPHAVSSIHVPSPAVVSVKMYK